MRTPTAREALLLLPATDPRHYVSPVPEDLTKEALTARQAFDLDAEMALARGLDDWQWTFQGAAGVRLRARLAADISDDLLREFALERLGAQRCSAKYLAALRIVLGNQADAEQKGYVLELNQRVPFASAKVMRTIIEQMQATEVTYGDVVMLGPGRSQVVQCFANAERIPFSGLPADELAFRDRLQEAADDARRAKDVSMRLTTSPAVGSVPAYWPSDITEADIPH